MMIVTASTPTTYAERFALNAAAELKKGSTWAAGVGILLLGVLAEWPGLAGAIDGVTGLTGLGAGIAALIVVIAAKLRPSTQASQTQAMIAELARHSLNEQLRARGLPEMAATKDVTAALPPIPTATVVVAADDPAPIVAAPAPAAIVAAAAAPVAPAAIIVDPTLTVLRAMGYIDEDALAAAMKALRAARRLDVPLPPQ